MCSNFPLVRYFRKSRLLWAPSCGVVYDETGLGTVTGGDGSRGFMLSNRISLEGNEHATYVTPKIDG